MAFIAWSDVVSFASELSAVPSEAQLDILEFVNKSISSTAFGGESTHRLRMARIYLASHIGKMSMPGSSLITGPVTSESLGPMSRSYAVLTTESGLEKTAYGGMYRDLVRNSLGRLPFVV